MNTTTRPDLELETDEALFQALDRGAGSDEALALLLGRHWASSYRLALAIVRDPASAEDAAQQAFVRVVEAARARARLDPFAGWLRTVVVNEARMVLRARRRRTRHEEATAMNRPESANRGDALAAVHEYAEALPEKLRVPVLLHFGLGLSHAEVADALGVPRPTASSWIQSGVARLRASFATTGVASGLGSLALDEVFSSALSVRESAAPARPAATAIRGRAGRVRPWLMRALAAKATLAAVALALAGTASLGLPAAPDARASGGASPSRDPVTAVAPEAIAAATSSLDALDESVARATPAGSLAPLDSGKAPVASSLASLAAWDEPESARPAYPWPTPEPQPAWVLETQRRLSSRFITLDFEKTPFQEAIDFLTECGLPKITLSPEARALVENDLPVVNLRLRDIRGDYALDLVVASSEDLRSRLEPDGVSVITSAMEPERPEPAPYHWVPNLVREPVRDEPWKLDDRKKLESQLVTFTFEETPMSEVVDFLTDVTGLNIMLSKSIDAEQMKLTIAVHEMLVVAALEAILAKTNLHWTFKNETLFISPREESREPPTTLARRHVSLDLRGVQVVDLIRELERQGITAVCSERTWDSPGTFSFVVPDEPLDEVVAELARQTPLVGRIEEDQGEVVVNEEDGAREGVLVLGGAVPSVRAALEAVAPVYSGLAAEIAECRARLLTNLPARRAARADRESPAEPLLGLERSVQRDTARIHALLERAAAVEGARERASALEARHDAALPRARAAEEQLAALRSEGEPDPARARSAKTWLALARGEIDEVRPVLAAARTDLYDLDALERGERLSFGVHAPRPSPTFLFSGVKLVNPRFTRKDLERAIGASGGRVVRGLDEAERLDYLVLLRKGEEDTKTVMAGLDRGATLLTEQELIDALPGLVHLEPRGRHSPNE